MTDAPRPSAPSPPYAAFSPGYANYALAILSAAYVMNFIDRQILSILLESIKHDLGLADWQLGLLSGTAFGVFYATLGIPIARLADRWSRKGVVIASLLIFSAMTALCGAAVSFLSLMVFRVGVAVGEAGGSPPSHSLISDYFPPERRATALGIFTLGVPLGVLFGFMAGGFLNDELGWRQTFFVVGVPGILLAPVLFLTVREPARPASSAASGRDEMPSTSEVIRYLAGCRTFRMTALGAGLYSFVGYSTVTWISPLMIRVHGMTTSEAGTWLAMILGFGGCIGTLGGGILGDRWARRDPRGRMLLPTLAMFACVPFQAFIYTASSGRLAMLWLIVPSVLGLMFQAPAYGLGQSLATPKTRATAASILLFVTNLIGLAMGPAVVGILSDLLAPSFGVDSLRFAMLIATTMLIPSGLCFWAASRTLEADLQAAHEACEREARGEPLLPLPALQAEAVPGVIR